MNKKYFSGLIEMGINDLSSYIKKCNKTGIKCTSKKVILSLPDRCDPKSDSYLNNGIVTFWHGGEFKCGSIQIDFEFLHTFVIKKDQFGRFKIKLGFALEGCCEHSSLNYVLVHSISQSSRIKPINQVVSQGSCLGFKLGKLSLNSFIDQLFQVFDKAKFQDERFYKDPYSYFN